MTNPFDDPDADYLVLRNDEGQHSLWRNDIDVPAGWTIVHGPGGREGCLEFVSGAWTDMRPASLVAWMGDRPAPPRPAP